MNELKLECSDFESMAKCKLFITFFIQFFNLIVLDSKFKVSPYFEKMTLRSPVNFLLRLMKIRSKYSVSDLVYLVNFGCYFACPLNYYFELMYFMFVVSPSIKCCLYRFPNEVLYYLMIPFY